METYHRSVNIFRLTSCILDMFSKSIQIEFQIIELFIHGIKVLLHISNHLADILP